MRAVVNKLEPILKPTFAFLNRHFWVAKLAIVLIVVANMLVWVTLAAALFEAAGPKAGH